ncbi:MAG: hypothetical protein A3G81_12045 [Betaproteobacteria bacterium RIFCSPLOWO2_12_FULL_65_14]|nr:MAG: hypothetical protein A3G81_12045 [Betaproteobacteria bacterium RIFCSPLOWO2_12_FULL_65_14]
MAGAALEIDHQREARAHFRFIFANATSRRYRSAFAEEVRNNGVEGLIALLSRKNATGVRQTAAGGVARR